MKTSRRQCGPVSVNVVADVPEAFAIAEFALPPASSDRESPLAVTIHDASGGDCASPEIAPGEQAFELKHDLVYAYKASSRSYRMWLGDDAWGTIDVDGGRAEWFVRHLLPPRTLLHALVLDPLSLLLPRFGAMICHGGAVVRDDRAVIVLGRSGAGKSTLTFLATHRSPDSDVRHLCDDTMILDFSGGRIIVHPIRTGFGLAPSFIEEFGLSDTPLVQRGANKAYLTALPNQAEGSYEVDAVVMLRNGEGPSGAECGDLSPGEFLSGLLASQTSIASPYVVQRLAMWRRVAQETRGIAIRYERYCDVATFVEALHRNAAAETAR